MDYGKVHINGKRIHHGWIGSQMFRAGLALHSPLLIELGRILMQDDIKDINKWHSMED